MKRWLTIAFLILISVLMPIQVLADNAADVVVRARGFVCGAPTLTVTWISDTELKLDWTPGVAAVATMVRAKVGSEVEDRSDGYLVYEGAANTYTDTAVDLDIIGGYVYYKAWCQNAGGVWEEGGSDSVYIGGYGMTLIAIMMLVLGLTLFAYIRTSFASCGIAALFWLFLWGYTRSNPIPGTTTGDFVDSLVYYGSILMMILMFIFYLSRRNRQRTLENRGYVVGENGSVAGNERPITEGGGMESETPEEYRARIRRALRRRRR